MGRQPCCDKVGLKRGPWTIEEDHKLMNFILNNGIHCWRMVPKLAGMLGIMIPLLESFLSSQSQTFSLSVFRVLLTKCNMYGNEGLLRCGKSCRLRWINYLRPDLKRGGFTETEENQIIQLHSRLGNRYFMPFFICFRSK